MAVTTIANTVRAGSSSTTTFAQRERSTGNIARADHIDHPPWNEGIAAKRFPNAAFAAAFGTPCTSTTRCCGPKLKNSAAVSTKPRCGISRGGISGYAQNATSPITSMTSRMLRHTT